jgi:transposase
MTGGLLAVALMAGYGAVAGTLQVGAVPAVIFMLFNLYRPLNILGWAWRHDDLQSLPSLEPAGCLVRRLPGADRHERCLGRWRNRRHPHQGTSLGRWGKRGDFAQAIGRSRGGRTTKIHALTDDAGRPRVLRLSAGNVNDGTMATALLAAAGPISHLMADRAYDANALRAWLAERGTLAVIPSTRSRTVPIPHDRDLYRQRNRIERMFCRLKDFRRVATRYDKLARNYDAAVHIAAIAAFWIN